MPRNKKGVSVVGDWLRAHVNYDGAGCLTWPFGRDLQGYGMRRFEGKTTRASRVICRFVNGEPPTGKPLALHNCGNGHKACCHPKHVYWGDHTDNQLDSVAQGTARKNGGPRQKLTDAQVVEIRAQRGRKTQRELAAIYGVRFETIGQIQRGRERKGGPRRSPNRDFTPTQRASMMSRAKQLRATGMTWDDIAADLDVCRLTARRFGTHATQ